MRKLIGILLLAALSAIAQTSSYPPALDTDASLFVTKDFAQSTLSSTIGTGDSTLTVADGSRFAVNQVVTICDASIASGALAGKCTAWEHMKVTNVAGNVLTVTRGVAGTSARSHLAGKAVSLAPKSVEREVLVDAVKKIQTALGANLSNVAAMTIANAALYNYPAIQPGGSLSIGSNSIVIGSIPAGVAVGGTAYISGGTGTAEAVPITGVGANNIIVTAANTHSGAWTIQSATAGMQEAISALQNGSGGVAYAPPGESCIYAGISVGDGSASAGSSKSPVRIMGAGAGVDTLNSPMDTGISRIRWCGANPGSTTYMLALKGPMGNTGVEHLMLDTSGQTNVRGMLIQQVVYSSFSDITVIRQANGPAIVSSTVNNGFYGSCNNTYRAVNTNQVGTGGSGMLLDGGSAQDSCSNTFIGGVFQQDGNTAGTYSVKLRFADNNAFFRTDFYSTVQPAVAGACSIMFEQYPTNTNFPIENSFYSVSTHAGVCGSTGANSARNALYDYHIGDCSSNCGPNFTLSAGTPIAVYGTSFGDFVNTGPMTMYTASSDWMTFKDASTTMGYIKRGGATGNGMVLHGFSETVVDTNAGFGSNFLRASTSNSLCYDSTSLTGYYILSTCSSLRKYKADVTPLERGMALIRRLRPISYSSLTSGRKEMGFIAEEVEKVEPRLATYDKDGALAGVDYGHITAVLAKALQELDTRVKALERKK